MAIIYILVAVGLGLFAAYKLKLEGDETPPLKIGLWNAHKHLTKSGVIIIYIAYALLLLVIFSI